MMKAKILVPLFLMILAASCINFEEEPILLIHPTAELSAHVKNERLFATALINVNPQILTAGNIPTIYEFIGELAIYNTVTGLAIDVHAFSGGGLAQVYTVSADTATHKSFVVIASGTVNAYADIGNDQDAANDRLISSGDFHVEATYLLSDFRANPAE